jgi:hypothetical protein
MYLTYDFGMSSTPKPAEKPPRDSLSVELGGWFKARATGAGVIAIPVIILVLAALAFGQGWLR